MRSPLLASIVFCPVVLGLENSKLVGESHCVIQLLNVPSCKYKSLHFYVDCPSIRVYMLYNLLQMGSNVHTIRYVFSEKALYYLKL